MPYRSGPRLWVGTVYGEIIIEDIKKDVKRWVWIEKDEQKLASSLP